MPLENGYFLNKRYRIVDILGQGGMGAVYRALDENLDVVVAVKENAFFSEEYSRQFQREARVLASLRHPNLPRVFDYFVIDQQGQYLVMDYIEGDDLRQWMSREESISEIEALQIGIEICNALIYLHTQDPVITHRDIKPGNIKITPEGEVLLVDFGLVKLLGDQEMTTTAARAMTPGYSPPEQYGNAPTDHRTDIYSLGATLYAALSGYLPEDSLARTTGKASLTPLRQYNPGVSRATAEAIEKAIELRFEDRWQSAREFKETLLRAKTQIPRAQECNSRIAQSGTDQESQTAKANRHSGVLSIFTRDGKALDPVWIIFGSAIALLLLLLIFSLVQPEELQSLLMTETLQETSANVIQTPQMAQTRFLDLATQTPNIAPSRTTNEVNPPARTPSPTPMGGGGVLAYVSERSGKPQLWTLDVPSSRTVQITNLSDGACQPDWSPDGSRLVFTSPCPSKRARYPGSSLYVVEVATGLITPLPASLEGDFDPAWSPDSEWIAYTSLVNGKMQLMKIKLADLSITRLSDGAYDDSSPAWSADGDKLTFVRFRSVGQIWLMDADGSNAVQFTLSGLIDNSNPTWYPNENLILFSQVLGLGSPSKQLFGQRLEDIGEEEAYLILPTSQMDYIPLMDNVAVSPDGIWLAFDYWYFDVLSDIYLMTFPGGNLIQMTDHPALDYDPVWKP